MIRDRIAPINVERTRRHMHRGTPDTLTLRRPFTFPEEEEFRARFGRWVRAWNAEHHTTNPHIERMTDATHVYLRISER